MKLIITLGGEERTVELERSGGRWTCRLDGREWGLDVVEVTPGVFSLLIDGQSFTVHVECVGGEHRVQVRGADFVAKVADPRRWSGRGGEAASRSGRQEVAAPMPGKVVRVLVEEGEEVEAGQGLLVVEAMKMQNELRAPKSGVVESLRAREGDTVEHGDVLLAVV